MRAAIWAKLTLVSACLPEGAPPWLVDHPIVASVRVDVAAPGPYAPSSPRPERQVAEVMPGDAIRVTPFLIGPDGPLDAEALAPAWFYCRATRCFADLTAQERPRACATEDLGPASTCRLGTGAAAQLQLGEMTSFFDLFRDPPSIFMISGTPEGPSTAQCLDRLRRLNDEGLTLAQCLLIVQPLSLGPLWRMMLLAGVLGLPDAPSLEQIPPGALTAEPSLFPGVRPFELTIVGVDGEPRARVAAPGETVRVAPGEQVEMIAPLDPQDAQLYFTALLSNGVPVLQAQFEVLTSSWLFTDRITGYQWTPQEFRWEVPEDASGAIHAYFLLSDQRSIVSAWLRFEVAEP